MSSFLPLPAELNLQAAIGKQVILHLKQRVLYSVHATLKTKGYY